MHLIHLGVAPTLKMLALPNIDYIQKNIQNTIAHFKSINDKC